MLPLKLKDYIDSRDGSFLITGPPGSGKTFLLTDLLEYLINEKNYDPARILVFCFNRRWAKILRDMSAEKINRSMPEIQITSIYAFCTDLLERIKSTYGMVRVLNAPARWRMLRDLIITDLDRKRYPISFKYLDYGLPVLNSFIQEVFDFILRAQENLIKPGMMLDKFTAFTDPFLMELAGIYMNFVDELKKKDLYDYGRLLTDTLEILKNDPGARDAVKKKYDIMIVDEVQEVNRAQFEIIEYLKNKKCIYFGNDDECIYAFRGSKTGSFSEVFNLLKGGAENSENILQLKVNYRSHQVIDQICREFITRNRQRVEKESDRPEGPILTEKSN
ncbi:MAG: hypothetical protein FJW66_08195, partial [Actinobacteria bacterium]|nr:hypothetical protein [Actinomycetota bacterium]